MAPIPQIIALHEQHALYSLKACADPLLSTSVGNMYSLQRSESLFQGPYRYFKCVHYHPICTDDLGSVTLNGAV